MAAPIFGGGLASSLRGGDPCFRMAVASAPNKKNRECHRNFPTLKSLHSPSDDE